MNKLIEIVRTAGKIAIDEQSKMNISVKEDSSIVTNGDLAVSQYLEIELKKLYPEYDIFSEENCENIPMSNKVIVIDPIDGTESYSRKEPSWAVLIGFLDNGVPIRGIVYQPALDRLYSAEKGSGAYLNDKGTISKISCLNVVNPLTAICTPKITDEEIQLLKDKKIENIIYMYSASLKIMTVASGDGDLYSNFRKKCSMWDLIAPLVILNESGGKMFFEEEMTFDFNKILMDKNFIVVNDRIDLDGSWIEI